MDELHIDKFTRDMMAGSKLELTNPGFDRLVMNKIVLANQLTSVVQNTVLYVLMFLLIDALIWVLLKFMDIRITEITVGLNAFMHRFQGILSAKLFYIYLFILGFIFLAVLITAGNGYQKV
jgi:hypothetical protein